MYVQNENTVISKVGTQIQAKSINNKKIKISRFLVVGKNIYLPIYNITDNAATCVITKFMYNANVMFSWFQTKQNLEDTVILCQNKWEIISYENKLYEVYSVV